MSNHEFHNIIRGLGRCERLTMLFRYAAAPVLHGCRPAALLTVGMCCLESWMESKDELLEAMELRCETLIIGGGAFVLLPYRPAALARALTRPKAVEILRARGYFVPDGAMGEGTEAKELRARLTETHLIPTLANRYVSRVAGVGAEFPHEIGLFLGYPPEDVSAFIENDGKNYACRTHWKVYHEPDAARAMCERIDRAKSEEADRLVSMHFERKARA